MKILSIVCAIFIISANADTEFRGDDKVIGGEEVSITEYPWQVSLISSYGHFCGGSIISRRSVITAAHCIAKEENPDFELFIRVRVGSSSRKSGGILKLVKKAIIHPDYEKFAPFDADIALLILWFPLVYNKYVQPIALPQQNEELVDDETVVVSGWGVSSNSSYSLPENLVAASVQVIDLDVCRDRYDKSFSLISDNMICAGILDIGGIDACQGDSGGPLALLTGKAPVVHGVVSWGFGCALAKYPGVYTRVSSYVDWIKKNAK